LEDKNNYTKSTREHFLRLVKQSIENGLFFAIPKTVRRNVLAYILKQDLADFKDLQSLINRVDLKPDKVNTNEIEPLHVSVCLCVCLSVCFCV